MTVISNGVTLNGPLAINLHPIGYHSITYIKVVGRLQVFALTGFSASVRLIEEPDKAWRVPKLMEKLAVRADNEKRPKQVLLPTLSPRL